MQFVIFVLATILGVNFVQADDASTNVTITMYMDADNYFYYSNAYFGNPLQGNSSLKIGFDSLSQASIIPYVNCTDCYPDGGWFNLTGEGVVFTNDSFNASENLVFGTCYQTTANVTMNNNTSDASSLVQDYQFWTMTEQYFPYARAGISVQDFNGFFSLTMEENELSYAYMLNQQQDLDKWVQISYDSDDNSSSTIVFGNFSIDYSKVVYEGESIEPYNYTILADYQLLNVTFNSTWSLALKSTTIGNSTFNHTYQNNDTEVLQSGVAWLDTRNAYLTLPRNTYQTWLDELLTLNFYCDLNECIGQFPCSDVYDQMHDIIFEICSDDDLEVCTDIAISPENYLLEIYDDSSCKPLVNALTTKYATLLGAPLFRNVTVATNGETFFLIDKNEDEPSPDQNQTFFAILDGNQGLIEAGEPSMKGYRIAFDTQSVDSKFISVDCEGCDNKGWYNISASTTGNYTDDIISLEIEGNWLGQCAHVYDTVCIDKNVTSNPIECVENLRFFEVVSDGVDHTTYNGTLGLGRIIENSPGRKNHSYVWQLSEQNDVYPQVVFMIDSLLEEQASAVFFGDWDTSDLEFIYSNTSYLPEDQGWAFETKNVTFNGISTSNFTNPSAKFSLAYQKISVFSDLFTNFTNYLEDNGFVCIKDAYGQIYVCEVSQECSDFDDLESFMFEFQDDESVNSTIYIHPSQYLNDTDDGLCKSMISEITDTSEKSFVFGLPFFSAFTVALDYQQDIISLYEKHYINQTDLADFQKIQSVAMKQDFEIE